MSNGGMGGQDMAKFNPWTQNPGMRGPAGTWGPSQSPPGPSPTLPGTFTPPMTNPWSGTGPRGAGAGPNAPGSGVSPGGPTTTIPGTFIPPMGNPWAGAGPRGAGAGTTIPGSGVSPGGPTTTMPGSIDPSFTGGAFNPMMGTNTPTVNPTLQTGGLSPTPTQVNPSFTSEQRPAPTFAAGDPYSNFQKPAAAPTFAVGDPFNNFQKPAAGPMSDTDYARSMYTGLLGRNPTDFEVSNASQALQGQYGGDRGRLADFFRQSNEYQGKNLPNPWTNATNPFAGPIDPRFASNRPYGTRPDIGSPGWQTMLRAYAARDGLQNMNQYIRDRGLTPMWGDALMSGERY